MNYVVVESKECGKQVFAFPRSIEPDRMTAALSYIRHGDDRNWQRIKVQQVDSGFVGADPAAGSALTAEMKYIVTDSEEAGKQLFIFPKSINHDRMAEVLSEVEQFVDNEYDNFYREPVSAGFTDGKTCYGKSESLNLATDKGDTNFLRA
jgi:hypothetical protein